MEQKHVEQNSEVIVVSTGKEEEKSVLKKTCKSSEETEYYPIGEPLLTRFLIVTTQGLIQILVTLNVI